MKRDKRIVFAADPHCGHEFGLTPPNWWQRDDTKYRRISKAGKFQRKLWDFYTKEIDKLAPIDILVVPGDAIEGKGERSGGTELITTDRIEQVKMAAEAVAYANAPITRLTFGCLTWDSKILKSDLSWVPVESLSTGDELLAFEENTNSNGNRKFVRSTVISNVPFKDEVYDLILSDGTKVTANGEHKFLMRRGSRKYEWVSVEHLYGISHPKTKGFGRSNGLSMFVPMPFPRTLQVWGKGDSYTHGYISGFFDGEGTVNQPVKRRDRNNKLSTEHGLNVCASQNDNKALEYCQKSLKWIGFNASTIKQNGRKTNVITILGGFGEKLRFLGNVRPKRLLHNFSIEKMGSTRSNGERSDLMLIDIRKAGEQTVYGLQTTSKTYISDGFLSHNTRYHTGRDEDFEAILTALCGKGASIHGHDFINVNGVNIDIKHKIGKSGIPHGQMTPIAKARLWNAIWFSEKERQPKADILIRAHIHHYNYCGQSSWLGITCPALTYNSAYGIRECEGLVDVGLIVIDITEKGAFTWQPILADFPELKVQSESL